MAQDFLPSTQDEKPLSTAAGHSCSLWMLGAQTCVSFESHSRKMIKGSEGLIYKEGLKEVNLYSLAYHDRDWGPRGCFQIFEENGDPGEDIQGRVAWPSRRRGERPELTTKMTLACLSSS